MRRPPSTTTEKLRRAALVLASAAAFIFAGVGVAGPANATTLTGTFYIDNAAGQCR